ncbi:hypothetical protein ENU1_072880 [Entamoeba nuttalli P19]|uniref:HRDC domain containing protein n=1 Tax=Entamoeba nuttalli (strain P19) TaxID=1076696 RepID=K2HXA4_ENTNP|nr:hypothetical protein ENU1_072880 [Entamoeba nuttalli P19]EKE40980.1 hypothetical protein ENU1_072880 [Entamoeba nuttalli P19]|eukprot:XP_008856686.1 hypothetical protein ENU1_072880 [Entamoeba nuttalli P19]
MQKLLDDADKAIKEGLNNNEESKSHLIHLIKKVLDDLGYSDDPETVLTNPKKILELSNSIIHQCNEYISEKQNPSKILVSPKVNLSVYSLESLDHRINSKNALLPIAIEDDTYEIESPILFFGDDTKQVWQYQFQDNQLLPKMEDMSLIEVSTKEELKSFMERVMKYHQVSLSFGIDKRNNYRGYICILFVAFSHFVYVLDILKLKESFETTSLLFESTSIEKVCYKAFGIRALYYQFKITTNNVFLLDVACQKMNICYNYADLFKTMTDRIPETNDEWMIRPYSKYVICWFGLDTLQLLNFSIKIRNKLIEQHLLHGVFVESDKEVLPGGRKYEMKRIIKKRASYRKYSKEQFKAFSQLCEWREKTAKNQNISVNEILKLGEIETLIASGASSLEEFSDVLPNNGMVLLYGDEITSILHDYHFHFNSTKQHGWINVEGVFSKEEPMMIFKHCEWKEQERKLKESIQEPYDILSTNDTTPLEQMILKKVLLTPSEEGYEELGSEDTPSPQLPESIEEIYKWSRLSRKINKKKINKM